MPLLLPPPLSLSLAHSRCLCVVICDSTFSCLPPPLAARQLHIAHTHCALCWAYCSPKCLQIGQSHWQYTPHWPLPQSPDHPCRVVRMGSAAVSARDKRVATTAETAEWGKGKGSSSSGIRAKSAIDRLGIYTIYVCTLFITLYWSYIILSLFCLCSFYIS